MKKSTRLIAYGDESITARFATFAFFLVRSDREVEVEHAIEVFLREAGVPPGTLMHSKDMFPRAAGMKSPWAGVPRENHFELFEQLCASVARITPRPVGSAIRIDNVPPVWKDQRSVLGGYDRKQLATLAYASAFLHVIKLSDYPRPRIVIDQDKTKIPFGSRRQAHNTKEIFLSEDGSVEGFVPEIARPPKPPALQLADLYAYALAHAIDENDPSRNEFRRLLDAGQFITIIQPPLEAVPHWKSAADRDTVLDSLQTLWVLLKDSRRLHIMWAPSNGAGHWVAAKLENAEEWLISLALDTYDEAMESARAFREERIAEGWELET